MLQSPLSDACILHKEGDLRNMSCCTGTKIRMQRVVFFSLLISFLFSGSRVAIAFCDCFIRERDVFDDIVSDAKSVYV